MLSRAILHFGLASVLLSPGTTLANTEILGQFDQFSLKQVKSLLEIPENDVDFAKVKLTIDQMIDATINVDHEMERLDQMVRKIKAMGNFSNSLEEKEALRHFLYDSGPWNDHRPFAYDFDDPEGTNLDNKLLSNYLSSREGNCVSMTVLFLALGQKVGIDVSASSAPNHILVKFTDDDSGITYNLETTSGANPARDEWLRQSFSISDAAIANGIYLRKLTHRETVAVMIETLLDYYFEDQQFGQLIATADLILQHHPKSIGAIIYMASAHNELLKAYGLWKYHVSTEVPADQRHIFDYLTIRINGYHNYAVDLGWRPTELVEREDYLDNVENIKLKATEYNLKEHR